MNAASQFLSPDLNKKYRVSNPEYSRHQQPRDAVLAIDKVKQLPRRARAGDDGYDAIGIVVVDCVNDGRAVELVGSTPSPAREDIFSYYSMIDRLSGLYTARFNDI